MTYLIIYVRKNTTITMNDFSNLITEPNVKQNSNVNEFAITGTIFALSCLAYALAPVLTAKIEADSKNKGNGGATFWDFLMSKKKDKDDNKSNNQNQNKENNEAFNSLLMIAKKSNQKEKDENTKKKNDAILKLITASSFDKDGNEVPLDKIVDNMKDTMSPEQFEVFKKDMTETYEKNKDNKEFKDSLAKVKANIKPEEYDKMLDEAKVEAKLTMEQIEKEKKEIEDYAKKLQDMEDEINGGDEKDKEIRELKKQLEELKNNPPQTLATAASGVATGGTPLNTDDTNKHTDDDKKQDEYKVQDEKIEDPKTGKKIKVKTYTGPRGGKFYYPEGKPKKPENKVYVESISLHQFMHNMFY